MRLELIQEQPALNVWVAIKIKSRTELGRGSFDKMREIHEGDSGIVLECYEMVHPDNGTIFTTEDASMWYQATGQSQYTLIYKLGKLKDRYYI